MSLPKKYSSKDVMVDKLKNMTLEGNIMLEPRLQEYLKKKIMYRNSNITPCITPEQEFQITNLDRRILRDFLKGKKDMYVDTYDKYLKTNEKRPMFPSSKLADDPRVPDIDKVKPSSETLPINRGMFMPEKNGHFYEDVCSKDLNSNQIIDPRDFPPYEYDGTGIDINNMKFNPRVDPRIDVSYIKNPRAIKNDMRERCNKYHSQYKIPVDPQNDDINQQKQKQKRKQCNNKYGVNPTQVTDYSKYDNTNAYKDHQILGPREQEPVDERYGMIHEPTYSAQSSMDLDNKMMIPTIASRAREVNIGNYRFESYFGQGDCRDTAIETELVRGMPKSRPHNRSYGYRNSEENQYQYIDDDFQSAERVEPWDRGGEASRITNKAMAKNRFYVREIM